MEREAAETAEAPEVFDHVRRIGVVSDTHGRLRSALFGGLEGVDLVLHAGDVVEPDHLVELGALAPLRAVWGNMDRGRLRELLPESRELEAGGVRIGLVHGHQGVEPAELRRRFPHARVVVHGHTHLPRAERHGGTLLLNPGSAGPRRGGKPICAALLELAEEGPRVRFLDLAD